MKTGPKCGVSNYPAQLYCGACGASLSSYTAPQVSVPKTNQPAKKGMTAAEVEAAFNYEPLIKAYQCAFALPVWILIAMATVGPATSAMLLTAYLAMLIGGIIILVLTRENANLLWETDPIGRRNLIGLLWLQVLLPILSRAFASYGPLVVLVALCADVAMLYARVQVIAKRWPSRVTLMRAALGGLWLVARLIPLGK